MLKLSDLASRADFVAGPLRVSPSQRLIEGPAGRVQVEPIVMKVFLLLIDAAGKVVTRDELFDNAWGGVIVGNDSLNRAITRIRRIAAETAPESFEIETIPRTGYRLTGEFVRSNEQAEANPESKVARRLFIGSLGGAAVLGVAGLKLTTRKAEERRFRSLLQHGQEALEYGDGSSEPQKYLREAVALRPNDPAAQGLLAYALVANLNTVNTVAPSSAVDPAERAATASLEINPHDPNARLARIQLQRSTLDLATNEDRLREVLASAPRNIFAMRLLWNLLQSTGRSQDALAEVQRAIAIKPLAAANNFPLAQLSWIVGRTAEADRIIDQSMQFWPTHQGARFARFTIFAFTGRPRAALAMLNNKDLRPQSFSPTSVQLWRMSLQSLDEPSPTNISRARDANLIATKQDPKLAWQAVMSLSALGEIDAGFEIANQLLVYRAFSAPAGDRGSRTGGSSTGWRFTPWLFTPPVASLRSDPRFIGICDGIGLTEYWRQRGIRPDYQIG